MIKTKLIIFDLDGTLLNTIGVITKALNKALVDFGFETYEEEDVKSKVGYGPRRLIEDSGLSTLFRTIFIRSFFYILQVFYNLVIHEYECYCTNSHNQINLFLALQNF